MSYGIYVRTCCMAEHKNPLELQNNSSYVVMLMWEWKEWTDKLNSKNDIEWEARDALVGWELKSWSESLVNLNFEHIILV